MTFPLLFQRNWISVDISNIEPNIPYLVQCQSYRCCYGGCCFTNTLKCNVNTHKNILLPHKKPLFRDPLVGSSSKTFVLLLLCQIKVFLKWNLFIPYCKVILPPFWGHVCTLVCVLKYSQVTTNLFIYYIHLIVKIK